jgi:branched-chain amino acid transport system substrate-binding protein
MTPSTLRSLLIGLAALTLVLPTPSSIVAQTGVIKLGGLTTLEGPFAGPGQDTFRGMTLALEEVNYTVAGKKVEWIKASSDAKPDTAVARATKLIEQDNVDILVGPLSGSEGLAVKEYAKNHPGKTFVNGTSAATDTTLRNPAPNFFRFTTEGAQWQAGLGSYVYDVKKIRKVALVSEDYSFPYSQVMGFMTEFCAKGGRVTKKFWVPLGAKDFSSVVAGLPSDVDAIYAVLGASAAINFLTQYNQAGGKLPTIGGSITLDQTVLASRGPWEERIVGANTAGPIADASEEPAWLEFVKAYKKRFPDGLPSPSLFAHGYYVSTKAVLLALKEVNGDLSDGQKKLQAALAKLKFDTPTGLVSLDENRQAIANIYVTEVARRSDGALYNKVVKVAKNVNQTLGMPRAEFLARGSASRDNPNCP